MFFDQNTKIQVRYMFAVWLFFFVACDQVIGLKKPEIEKGKKGMVLMVMVPDCPLSQNYSTPFLKLKSQFEKDFNFWIVVPAKFYNHKEIEKFASEFEISKNNLFVDTKNQYVKSINARISPEFFLMDSLGQTRYQGAFDDWVETLGTKKIGKRKKKYLSSAIGQYLNQEAINPNYNKAEGCYLEL